MVYEEQTSCLLYTSSAFAAVFCEDLENKYLRYSIGRGNLKKYVLSKVIVIYVSSIITMILGTLLFIMYLRLQLPWTSDLATSSISGMYHAIRFGPVSYTHLDVYKRQEKT